MKVSLFDFELPPHLIATQPLQDRSQGRLLLIPNLEDRHISDVPNLVRPGDVVVFNDTKVLPTQLKAQRGEATLQITLYDQIDATTWWAFAKPGRRLKVGDDITFDLNVTAHVTHKDDERGVCLFFHLPPDLTLIDFLDRSGAMPLPPYMKRTPTAADKKNYQTVYAKNPGAVAAPTAGFHFTQQLLSDLTATGVHGVHVTLHVGAGTFRPVKVKDTTQHLMHAEYGEITPQAAAQINKAKAQGGRVIAVGTTALRLLESASDAHGILHPFAGKTDIFITPGYTFKIVDVLMTNFHLPKSTLFMLVSAFGGLSTLHKAYQHAIAAGYRFYSYGDACWLFKEKT